MMARRRQSMDLSPCNSSNSKYVKAVGWWATPTSDENAKANLEALSKRRFSSASCMAWSMSSFLERCPISTPSPIVSPVSSISCSPPSELYFSQPSTELCTEPDPIINENKSSCIVFNGCKKPTIDGREEEKEIENAKASLSAYTPKLDSYRLSVRKTRDRTSVDSKDLEGFLRDHHHRPEPMPRSKSMETIQERLCRKKEMNCPDARLINSPHAKFSLAGSKCSAYGDSDVESSIDGPPQPFPRAQAKAGHAFESEMKRNEVEAKLLAWKEANIHKLVNGLRKKEAEFDMWEYKQKSKARKDMKEFERKMEEKMQIAYQKMQKKIGKAEMKAEEKKAKEKEIVARKISKISNTVDKIQTTGKLPWMLLLR